MADDITIDYGIDPSTYLAGAAQITQANSALNQSFGQVITTGGLMSRALDAVTPKRAALLGWGALATAAADTQQAFSTLEGQSTITGARIDRLVGSVNQLSRQVPLGAAAIRGTVQQFAQMGVVGADTETKVAKLTRTVANLSGATGEGPAQLAQGMTDLARATGNTNLDPARFAKLGDALTTVSLQSGASASSVLAFSKNIAPMAQAAGIGATGVLGISSAFARLGEDGVGASTAVNKMLTDMSRAVREGGPELKTYAEITGRTVDQFTALAKSNPAEALTQVTESIAKAGNQGPRMLEQLGLDGVRSMRALQALSASGGLRPAIAEAQAGYGSGSAQKAADVAFQGLNDSVTELQNSSSQLADALGAPLLKPLTTFANLLNTLTGGLANAAGSSVGQGVLGAGLTGVVGALGLRAVAGPLSLAFLGRQALTSGPLQSLAGGFASGGADGTFLGRYGARAIDLANAGTLATSGPLGGLNQRLYNLGSSFRAGREQGLLNTLGESAYYDRMYGQQESALGRGGPGFLSRVRGIAGNIPSYLNAGATMLFNQSAEAARNSRVPFDERRSTLGLGSAGQAAQRAYDASSAFGNSRLTAAGDALKAFHTEITSAGKGIGSLRGTVGAFGTSLKEATLAAGSMAKAGVGGAIGGVRGLLSSMGPGLAVTAGIAGGFALYQAGQSNLDSRRQSESDYANSGVQSALDAYRESIGKATAATDTVGAASTNYAQTVSKSAATMTQATQVTDADRAAAAGTSSKVTTRYQDGTAAQIAAQVAAISPAGLAPDELQAVKVDLLRQFSPDKVQDVLRQLPGTVSAGSSPTAAAMDPATMNTLIAGLAGGNDTGFKSFGQDILSRVVTGNSQQNINASGSDVDMVSKLFKPGGALSISTLSDTQRGQINALGQGIQKTYSDQADRYGTNYADQTRYDSMQRAINDAMKTGNADLVNELAHTFSIDLFGASGAQNITMGDLENNGGDLANTFAKGNPEFAKNLASFRAGRSATGAYAPLEQQGIYSQVLGSSGSALLGKIFDNRNNAPEAQTVQASLAQPSDVGLQSRAVDAMLGAAKDAGTSMTSFAADAARAAASLSETSPEFALIQQAIAKAGQQIQFQASMSSPSAGFALQFDAASSMANMAPSNNATTEQQRQQGIQDTEALLGQARQRMVARLQVQHEFEISSQRSSEDYNKTVTYAEQDYETQRSRTLAQFNLSMSRQQADYQLQVARSEQDFYTQRGRQLRDFNISQARGEEDFLTQRSRSIRDFNLSMQREMEDAAKAIYDPYSRIQTKATWDAKNLLQNLGEQTKTIQQQVANLATLRQAGLSNAAISMLGLTDASNAQQVANLVNDALQDPSVLRQLNAATTTRQSATTSLESDPANTSMQRQQQDFARSMADQETDRQKQLQRSKDDLARSMADQGADFAKSLARGNEDFNKSVARANQDLAIGLANNEADFTKSLARQRDAMLLAQARMREDLARSDQAISSDFQTLAEQTDKAIHGRAVDWGKLITNDTASFISDLQTKVLPQVQALAGQFGIDLVPPSQYNATTMGSQRKLAVQGGYAEGGPIGGRSPHPKADDKLIWATSGEFMQPVAAVNHYGADVMEAIRTLQVPKEAFQGLANGGMVGGSGAAGHTSSQALGLALQQLTNVVGMCLSQVQDWWASGHRYPDAWSQWTATIQHKDRNPPPGAPVFFSGGAHGHVALAAGNGLIRSTDAPNRGYVGTVPISYIETAWNHPYVGWGSTLAGVPLLFDTKPGQSVPGATVTPALADGGTPSGGGNLFGAQLAQILSSSLDQRRGGWYGKLRDTFQAGASRSSVGLGAALGSMAAGTPNARANQQIAASMMAAYGWGPAEMSALIQLWNGESGWNQLADNPTSDAYGIPQALPGNKMASVGGDWRTNPATQITWGLNYIRDRYGSPSRAWSTWQSRSPHWYDEGGIMPPGKGSYINATGKPEAVLTNQQWGGVTELVKQVGIMVSQEQGRAMRASEGGGLTVHHHNERITYDSRTDFTGAQVVVQSNDPDDMGRKLAQRGRRFTLRGATAGASRP